MQAAARFEPEREVRFSTCAAWWIRSAMQDYILRNWSIVRTGTTSAQKSLFFNLRRLRARIGESAVSGRLTPHGREWISQELRVPVADVETMEQRLSGSDQSLNAAIGDDSDDDWQDFLADTRPTPDEVVIGMRDSATRSRWLAEAIGELSDREQIIIRQRRLKEDGATLEELGRQLGVAIAHREAAAAVVAPPGRRGLGDETHRREMRRPESQRVQRLRHDQDGQIIAHRKQGPPDDAGDRRQRHQGHQSEPVNQPRADGE